jgi:membrane-associated phospholipid phosphatase
VAVACSRVFLDVHWLSDVVAGLALAWAWFAFCAIGFGSIPRGPRRARSASVEGIANA